MPIAPAHQISSQDVGSDPVLATMARPVVFTNGVFDLLHRGHCNLLGQARSLGASLVVGINSDTSARRLGKGPERPINSAEDRAAVLRSLAAVDHVITFDEDTPCELLERLRPDVYVKGGDYDMDQLREAVLVRGWGGRALTLPYERDVSTTRIVERIRAAYPKPADARKKGAFA
jgi:rfaE bifunctional protein nucleotidyltransferase chain/domain